MVRSITYDDILIMQQYFDADQHSMVYHYYYGITGSPEAQAQSQISDPNTFLGQVAMGANESAQFLDSYGLGLYPPYGLYNFSREIAQNFLDTVKADVDAGGTGIIPDNQIVEAAQGVWNQHGIGNLFPGSFLTGNLNSEKSMHWLVELLGLCF